MGTADGAVISTTKVIDHGADADRWVLVVLGDGYTNAQQTDYENEVTALVADMQATPPFNNNWNRVNVRSDETGTDNPCGADGQPVSSARTYFDSAACNGGLPRLVDMDWDLAKTTARNAVSAMDAVAVVINSAIYAGGGHPDVAAFTRGRHDMAMHEMGHSYFGLADEYSLYSDCGEAGHDNYTGSEPSEPNVTKETVQADLKWRAHITGGSLQTQPNTGCNTCEQANALPAGTVGLYEGAQYFKCGLYRPQHDCRMRHNVRTVAFCIVCQDMIARILARRAPDRGCCFVATAVYGDEHHPDVVTLRRWRNQRLADGAVAMRALAAGYQVVGPALARFTEPRPRLASLIRRRVLAPLAARVRGDDKAGQRRADRPPPCVGCQEKR